MNGENLLTMPKISAGKNAAIKLRKTDFTVFITEGIKDGPVITEYKDKRNS